MRTLLADIAHGNTSLADTAFLVAVIVAVIATVVSLVLNPRNVVVALLSAAVAFTAFGFLVL